jgi:hypothetical protein
MILFNRENLPEMYSKALWMNPDIEYVFHKTIVEYDMQQASLSVSRRFHLIPDNELDILVRMPKEKRTREIGLRQRDDKEFSENMINGVLQTRKEFIDENHLTENEIVTLHSDALMFIQKHKIKDNIDGVQFIHKNTWTSYIRYGRVEMFYVDGTIEYKGIPKQMLQQHTLGMNQYLLTIFKMVEDYNDDVYRYISHFQKMYLQDKLPEYYYIPFGNTGKQKVENLKLLSFIAKIVMHEMR